MQAWQSGLLAGADGADETAEACRAARIRVLRASLEEGRGQRDALSVGACHFPQAGHLRVVFLAGAKARQQRWTRICIHIQRLPPNIEAI
jgi:hypothetical protein